MGNRGKELFSDLTPVQAVPDPCVLAVLESKHLDVVVHDSFLLLEGFTNRPLHLSCVQQHLLHRQHADEGVDLLHIACVPPQEGLGWLGASKEDFSSKLSKSLAACKEANIVRISLASLQAEALER